MVDSKKQAKKRMTTIQVEQEVADELAARGSMRDTYSAVIRRLLFPNGNKTVETEGKKRGDK